MRRNIEQVRFTYGPHAPLLASIATKVYYTPSDHETAAWISEQLGTSTERLHPESRNYSLWGLFTSRSVGTTEHERPLLTSDEVSRLDESAALIVVKGMAPILGRKLGSPVPEVIDLTSSRRRMVAAVAGALLLGGSLAAFWLWPQPSPPTLTMTAPTEPTMSLVHPAPTAKITPRERLMEHQRMFMHRPPQPAWALHKLEMPSGKGSYVMRSLRAERAFADHGQCTQALLAEVSRWHAMVATSPRPSSASPMTAMKRSPRG